MDDWFLQPNCEADDVTENVSKAVTVDISKDIKKAVTKDVPVNWS